jgi:ubiquinone/menaquinone biosynthesis C-methylase UbiE
MNISAKKIINKQAYRKLEPYFVKPYQINEQGEIFVINSNRNLSEEYFEHLLFPVSNFWGKYFEEKINILHPRKKEVMIDICCGTGTLCLNVIPKLGFSKCIAIDNSRVAIEVLEKRIQKNQPIEARNEDITKTSFGKDSIDAIYGNSFLHHIPNNHNFFSETFRILRPGGIVVLTGEPTVAADVLENIIMMTLIKGLDIIGLRRTKQYDDQSPVTDIWLYEEESLRQMLVDTGFIDIKIHGFGILVPLLNWPSALVFGKIFGKSMQPDWYWRIFGWLDRKLFSWLPANKHSHLVIAARKPE